MMRLADLASGRRTLLPRPERQLLMVTADVALHTRIDNH